MTLQAPTGKFVATLHTAENRGDHAADVTRVFVLDGTETVAEIGELTRLTNGGSFNDHVVLQAEYRDEKENQ